MSGDRGRARAARLATATVVCPLSVLWTELSLRRVRRELADRRVTARVPPSILVSPLSTRAAAGWLRARRASCLERSLIMQRWLFAGGEPHDVLIGVASSTSPISAHAWLDNEAAPGYQVIARVNPLRTP